MNETLLSSFLEEQIAFDGAVESYAYISVPLSDFQYNITNGSDNDYYTSMSDATGYNLIDVTLYAVPEWYLSVIDTDYYFPNSF